MMCFTFLHSPYSICQVFFLINMVYDDEITYMYNHYRKKILPTQATIPNVNGSTQHYGHGSVPFESSI